MAVHQGEAPETWSLNQMSLVLSFFFGVGFVLCLVILWLCVKPLLRIARRNRRKNESFWQKSKPMETLQSTSPESPNTVILQMDTLSPTQSNTSIAFDEIDSVAPSGISVGYDDNDSTIAPPSFLLEEQSPAPSRFFMAFGDSESSIATPSFLKLDQFSMSSALYNTSGMHDSLPYQTSRPSVEFLGTSNNYAPHIEDNESVGSISQDSASDSVSTLTQTLNNSIKSSINMLDSFEVSSADELFTRLLSRNSTTSTDQHENGEKFILMDCNVLNDSFDSLPAAERRRLLFRDSSTPDRSEEIKELFQDHYDHDNNSEGLSATGTNQTEVSKHAEDNQYIASTFNQNEDIHETNMELQDQVSIGEVNVAIPLNSPEQFDSSVPMDQNNLADNTNINRLYDIQAAADGYKRKLSLEQHDDWGKMSPNLYDEHNMLEQDNKEDTFSLAEDCSVSNATVQDQQIHELSQGSPPGLVRQSGFFSALLLGQINSQSPLRFDQDSCHSV